MSQQNYLTISIMVATFFSFFSIVPSTGFSQATSSGSSIGLGYSMFGRNILDLDAFNSRLNIKGYSKISENFFSVGGGGHAILSNKILIGGEGHSILGDETTNGNSKSSLTGGYGLFDIGYLIYAKHQLRFYPMLGIGGGGMTFRIRQQPASLTFDEVLDNPERGVELSTNGFILSFSVGVDYLLLVGGDESGKGGFVFGIRAGYVVSPFKRDWMLDELELTNAPEVNITGPFFTLMFGGGGSE